MLVSMSDAINLADPSFEPTDEQLAGLMSRAFAGVTAAHEQALVRLRAEIEVLRAEARRAQAERSARDPERT
jgi:hypothetical protein